MFKDLTNKISQKHLGIVLIIAGVILLMHTLHILERWLDWLIIIFSLTMIIYGAIKADVWGWIKSKLQKREHLPK